MSTLIVVPTWNNIYYLSRLLDSLFRMTFSASFRVIVVDNGSFDGTPEMLSDQGIETIRNETNLGFVKATNQGLEKARDGENVMLLNDDCHIVDPYWLKRMTSKLNGDIGAVGPKTNMAIGTHRIEFDSGLPLLHEVEFLIGFCMLIRADAFKEVGLLDERFGLGGGEDLDYSMRLKNSGYKICIDRSVFVFHHGSMTINRFGGWKSLEANCRRELMAKWGKEEIQRLLSLEEEVRNAAV